MADTITTMPLRPTAVRRASAAVGQLRMEKPRSKPRFYYYRAKNNSGVTCDGYVRAVDKPKAIRAILDRGHHVLYLEEVSVPQTGRRRFTLDAYESRRPLALFMRQLSVMIGAGIRVDRALGVLAAQCDDSYLADALAKAHRDVLEGMPLSRALARHSQYFSMELVIVIESGERGGTLPKTLERLARTLENQLELAGRVRAALNYPLMVFAMMLAVNFGLFTWLLPKFKPILMSLGVALPAATKALLFLSDLTLRPAFWVAVGTGCVLLGLALRRLWRRPKSAYKLDTLRLRIPVIGEVYKKWILAESFAVLAEMSAAGILLEESLRLGAKATNSPVYERAYRRVAIEMLTGKGLAKGFALSPDLFPRFVVQMMTLVEEAGEIDRAFARTAAYYREELDVTLRNLTSAMEPLMVVGLGAMTITVVMAVFLPIYRVMSHLM